MRVFLAWASGVIGRRLVPRLVRAGHEVVGMTRDPARAGAIEAAGAQAVLGDALDAAQVRRLVSAAAHDAVVQHLTDLRQGQARARMAAGAPELAHRLSRAVRLVRDQPLAGELRLGVRERRVGRREDDI